MCLSIEKGRQSAHLEHDSAAYTLQHGRAQIIMVIKGKGVNASASGARECNVSLWDKKRKAGKRGKVSNGAQTRCAATAGCGNGVVDSNVGHVVDCGAKI